LAGAGQELPPKMTGVNVASFAVRGMMKVPLARVRTVTVILSKSNASHGGPELG